jgi:hypothetical protein
VKYRTSLFSNFFKELCLAEVPTMAARFVDAEAMRGQLLPRLIQLALSKETVLAVSCLGFFVFL